MYKRKRFNSNNNNNSNILDALSQKNLPETVDVIQAINTIYNSLTNVTTIGSNELVISTDNRQQLILQNNTIDATQIKIKLGNNKQVEQIELVDGEDCELISDDEDISMRLADLQLVENEDFINCYYLALNRAKGNIVPKINVHDILKDKYQISKDIQTYLAFLAKSLLTAKNKKLLHYTIKSHDNIIIDENYPLFIIKEPDNTYNIYYAKITDDKLISGRSFREAYPAVKLILQIDNGNNYLLTKAPKHDKTHPSSRFFVKKSKAQFDKPYEIYTCQLTNNNNHYGSLARHPFFAPNSGNDKKKLTSKKIYRI